VRAGLGEWFRANLFPSPGSGLLTLVMVPLCLFVLYALGHWMVVDAHWSVVSDNLRILLVGTFPIPALWRVWVATLCFTLLCGLTMGVVVAVRTWPALAIIAAFLLLAAAAAYLLGATSAAWSLVCAAAAPAGWALSSFYRSLRRALGLLWVVGVSALWAFLAPAGTDHWGGLFLSVLVTVIGAILSFPLGILLALGRRSRMRAIALSCVGYIELIRSLPLISVLYWAWIVVPLVLPPTLRVVDLARGIAGFVLFYAAYTAEYVRGGLQSVPEGQLEAAQSLGLNRLQSTYYVVLPQAIRSVIPGLVGNVLDIFDNVPLVFIIGLTDFLRAGQTVLSNPQYIGRENEIYAFLFFVYLLVASAITFAARRLERSMGLGER
jgi:general L-amino acid transport system permease protein